MNDRPILSDDTIRGLLEARAERAETAGLLSSVRLAAAATPQRRAGRFVFGFGLARGPLVASAASVVSVAVLVVVFGLATGWRISGGVTPTAGPASSAPTATFGPSAEPSPAALPPVLPLTVDQLNTFMAMNSQSPAGRQLVITGTIGPNLQRGGCNGLCTAWVLEGSNPTLYVQPPSAVDPATWITPGGSLTGPFAATMGDAFVLDYQGPVLTTADGGAWLPNQLPDPSTGGSAVEFRLVQGWLGGMTGSPSCPFVPNTSPYPGPQYGCGAAAYLSNGPFQPWTANGFEPPDGLRVQNGAFAEFAPLPPTPGAAPAQQATFLLRGVHVPTHFYWSVVARVGPWPFPTTSQSPAPSPSLAAAAPVLPVTVDELNAYLALDPKSLIGRQLVISGTVEPNPIPQMPAGSCVTKPPCWFPVVLAGSSPVLAVVPVGDRGAGPWDKNGPTLTGVFAAVLVNDHTLTYEGPVSTPTGGVWLPSQLPDPSGSDVGVGYWLVQGWISGVGIHLPCPSEPASSPTTGPQYACGGLTSFLIDDSHQSVTVTSSGVSIEEPPGGIVVQDDAYQDFAPAPDSTGVQTRPEQVGMIT